jgi:HSP20 family molecular chaperone IbpA
VQLNEEVDSGAASATYENGLLSIHLPVAKKSPAAVKLTIQSTGDA